MSNNNYGNLMDYQQHIQIPKIEIREDTSGHSGRTAALVLLVIIKIIAFSTYCYCKCCSRKTNTPSAAVTVEERLSTRTATRSTWPACRSYHFRRLNVRGVPL